MNTVRALRSSRRGRIYLQPVQRVCGAQETVLAGRKIQRRLSAIMAADVAGYSRLVARDEEGALRQLAGHFREVIEPAGHHLHLDHPERIAAAVDAFLRAPA